VESTASVVSLLEVVSAEFMSIEAESIEAESMEDELLLCVEFLLSVGVVVDELFVFEQAENMAIIASILQAAITFFPVFPFIITFSSVLLIGIVFYCLYTGVKTLAFQAKPLG